MKREEEKPISELYPPGFIESESKRPRNKWEAQYMCKPVLLCNHEADHEAVGKKVERGEDGRPTVLMCCKKCGEYY